MHEVLMTAHLAVAALGALTYAVLYAGPVVARVRISKHKHFTHKRF